MSDAPQGPGWWQASDQRWYPPEQHPGYQPPQFRPQYVQQKSSNAWWIALLVVGGVLMLLGVGCVAIIGSIADDAGDGPSVVDGVESNSGNTDNPPQADITSVDCSTGDIGWMTAEVEVTNHSSERSTYWITVVFENEDGSEQFDSTSAFVSDLEPGQSGSTEAMTATDAPEEGFTCRVVEVDRTAS